MKHSALTGRKKQASKGPDGANTKPEVYPETIPQEERNVSEIGIFVDFGSTFIKVAAMRKLLPDAAVSLGCY